jgi:HK97 family phage prohead protease
MMPANEGMERRALRIGELRVVDGEGEDDRTRIEGYAAVFDVQSEDLGGFREVIRAGAFAKTVQEADVRALWNHSAEYPLGRTRAGTLDLAEDDQGLAFTIWPPDTQYARDLLVSMRRGDVDQMSFGFEAIRDEWTEAPAGGLALRMLLEVRLYDVSPVTFPAYPQTSAEVRARVREFQDAAPGQGAHAEGAGQQGIDLQGRMDLMRRRVELAERE